MSEKKTAMLHLFLTGANGYKCESKYPEVTPDQWRRVCAVLEGWDEEKRVTTGNDAISRAVRDAIASGTGMVKMSFPADALDPPRIDVNAPPPIGTSLMFQPNRVTTDRKFIIHAECNGLKAGEFYTLRDTELIGTNSGRVQLNVALDGFTQFFHHGLFVIDARPSAGELFTDPTGSLNCPCCTGSGHVDDSTYTPILRDAIQERARQVRGEGYDVEHDCGHTRQELTRAAMAYLAANTAGPNGFDYMTAPPSIWPWARDDWKPSDKRRNLVKAIALLLAEGERADHFAAKLRNIEQAGKGGSNV